MGNSEISLLGLAVGFDLSIAPEAPGGRSVQLPFSSPGLFPAAPALDPAWPWGEACRQPSPSSEATCALHNQGREVGEGKPHFGVSMCPYFRASIYFLQHLWRGHYCHRFLRDEAKPQRLTQDHSATPLLGQLWTQCWPQSQGFYCPMTHEIFWGPQSTYWLFRTIALYLRFPHNHVSSYISVFARPASTV